MGKIYKIAYRLPVSAIRVTGTKVTTTDSLDPANKETRENWDSEPELIVLADSTELNAEIKAGALRNTNAAMEFTEDRRLTSATSETSGTIVPLAMGLVKAGLAGAALAFAPAGVGFLGIEAKVRGGLVAEGLVSQLEEPEVVEEDPAEARYRTEHPHEYALLKQAGDVIVASEISLATSIARSNADPTLANLSHTRRQRLALEGARQELGRLRRHFEVWRATLISTERTQYELSVTLDALCEVSAKVSSSNRALVWTEDPPRWARVLWTDLGVFFLLNSDDWATEERATKTKGVRHPAWQWWKDKDHNSGPGVLIRQPRSVTVSTYSRQKGADSSRRWHAKLISTEEVSVFDSRSPLDEIPFRTSLFSKRQVSVEMSDAGGLTKYSHSTTSSGKEIGEGLSNLPGEVVDALDQGRKAQEKLQAMADHNAIADLERLKRDVERKQKEIELSGLAATEEDYAELKALEQRASMLETRRKIAVSEATSDQLAGEIAVLKQQLERDVASRELTTEQLLGELRIVATALDEIRALLGDDDEEPQGKDGQSNT